MGYFSSIGLDVTVGQAREDAQLDARDGLPVQFACTPQPTAPDTDGMVHRREYYTEGMLGAHEARDVWAAAEQMRAEGKTTIYTSPGLYGVDLTTTRRRAKCRACGREMPKGTEVVGFAYRWGEFQRFGTYSYVHATPCATFTDYR